MRAKKRKFNTNYSIIVLWNVKDKKNGLNQINSFALYKKNRRKRLGKCKMALNSMTIDSFEGSISMQLCLNAPLSSTMAIKCIHYHLILDI